MSLIQRALITVTMGLPVLTAACGGGNDKNRAPAESASVVKIEKVEWRLAPDTFDVPGTVVSKTRAVLSSKLMATVVALNVKEGDTVRAGQTLAQLDSRDVASQVRRAEAGLREAEQALDETEQSLREAESARRVAAANNSLAEATFKRYEALLERRSVSRQEFDEVQTRYRVTGAELDRAEKSLATIAARQKQVMARIDQAKADLDTARVRAGYALITSPINGVVTARQTDIGQTASPGVPLLTIEDSDNYQIEAAVEESRISAVHLGDSVAIGVDALGDRFEGRVTQIVPSSDPASRSFTVKIDLPGDGFKKGLRSGLFARAVFSVGEKQALLILSRAVSRHGQLTSVYVVDQSGIARSRFVKTGVVYGERVEVLSGLEQGERIIVDNLDSVRDGSRVTADGEYE